MRIYQSVLPTLRARGIPYLFTSTYLQAQPTPYAAVKRIGEEWVRAGNTQQLALIDANSDPQSPGRDTSSPALRKFAGVGKMVRLWNIYGRERIGLRSHVVGDWLHQCHHQHRISARTNGLEARQLLHGQDVAAALVLLMRYFEIGRATRLNSSHT